MTRFAPGSLSGLWSSPPTFPRTKETRGDSENLGTERVKGICRHYDAPLSADNHQPFPQKYVAWPVRTISLALMSDELMMRRGPSGAAIVQTHYSGTVIDIGVLQEYRSTVERGSLIMVVRLESLPVSDVGRQVSHERIFSDQASALADRRACARICNI